MLEIQIIQFVFQIQKQGIIEIEQIQQKIQVIVPQVVRLLPHFPQVPSAHQIE